MDPSYQRIADLFGLEVPSENAVPNPGTPRSVGRDAEESSALGGQHLAEGNYETAILHFRRAVEQAEEGKGSMLMNLGGALETADMEPQALRQYRLAVKESSSAEPLMAVADLYQRAGRWRDSIKELEQALVNSPEEPYTYHKISKIYRETGFRAKALEFAQKTIANSPSDSFYHQWAGDLLLEMNRPAEAIDAFRAALELSPGDDFLFLRASIAFWKLGKKVEAIKSVRIASDLDPDNLLYYGLLSVLLNHADMQEESRLEAKKASKMDEYDRERLRRLAQEFGF